MTVLTIFKLVALICSSSCSFSWHIRTTKCLEKYPVMSSTKLPLNGTGWNCKVYKLKGFEHDITTCNMSLFTVDQILNSLPTNTECIRIIVNNTWYGHLPLEVKPINISAVSRFPNLTCFLLSVEYGYYYQLYPLIGKPSLFQNLEKLKILSLNAPLQDKLGNKFSISDILKGLSIECLDFTNVRGLELTTLYSILKNSNHSSLRYLYLRKFQYIGRNGFTSKLNFTEIIQNSGIYPNLFEIDLSGNALSRVTPGITKFAPNLKWIDVSENILIDSHNHAFLAEILVSNTLEYINYDYQGYSYHRGKEYINKTSMPLKNAELVYKSSQMPKRTKIVTSKPDMTFIQWQFIINCANIETGGNISTMVDNRTVGCKFVQCNLPQYFGDFNCDDWPVFPPLGTFFNRECMSYIEIPVGKNLEYFHFSFIHYEEAQTLGVVFSGKFCVVKNKIREIYVEGNAHWVKAFKAGVNVINTRGFMGLENLERLILSYNQVVADQRYIPMGQIANAPKFKLEHFDLSGNYIIFRKTFQMCRDFPRMKELVLRGINVTHLPPNLIKNCTMLKTFKVGNNSFKPGSLSDLDLNGTDLSYIELTYTGLAILQEPFMSKIDAFPNLTLDLSHNPLSCNCSTTSQMFTRWMILNKHKLKNYYGFYCSGPGGSTFVHKINVDEFWKGCHKNNLQTVGYSISVTLAAVLTVLLLIFLYRRRHRVKYACFTVRVYLERCLKGKQQQENLPVIWRYDAFISYCADDRFWVHSTLMKTLEEVYGFHLCIHYRDFPIGAAIDETICQSMTHSREIILVLSDYALRSGWCQFELTEALAQIDRRNKKLIVIKLGTLERYLLDPKVAHILDNHTYLEWSDNKDSHALFWAKLVGTIYGDTQGSCLCWPSGTRALGYQDIRDVQLDGQTENVSCDFYLA